MRTIVHISMPESLRLYMVKRAKESGYASISEYVRDLVRTDQENHLAKPDESDEFPRTVFREGRLFRY